MNMQSLLNFSRIALGAWADLDQKDRARVKLNFRAWIVDARNERMAKGAAI